MLSQRSSISIQSRLYLMWWASSKVLEDGSGGGWAQIAQDKTRGNSIRVGVWDCTDIFAQSKHANVCKQNALKNMTYCWGAHCTKYDLFITHFHIFFDGEFMQLSFPSGHLIQIPFACYSSPIFLSLTTRLPPLLFLHCYHHDLSSLVSP